MFPLYFGNVKLPNKNRTGLTFLATELTYRISFRILADNRDYFYRFPQHNFINMDGISNLEIFFESSPDLLCIAGFDGYFKKINAAVSKTLGYTMEELFARPINSFVYPEDQGVTSKKRENLKVGITLMNFDNRYVTKNGDLVWLTWTSVPIEGQELIFAIAKDITYKKKIEEYKRISNLLINPQAPQNEPSNEDEMYVSSEFNGSKAQNHGVGPIKSHSDQIWLSELEALIRKYTGQMEITISMLSDEMAISERQLFRRIKTIVGLTPNRYIRIIRLQLAKEALKTGKYRTIAEVSFAAGFKTPGYFSKLFKDVYGSDVSEFI